jgi:hypothetical protein
MEMMKIYHMTTVEIYFRSIGENPFRTPYIRDEETVEYICDGNEGTICFDGYYYVEDHAPPYPEDDEMKPWERPTRYAEYLPQTLHLYVTRRETEPWKKEVNEEGTCTTYHYNTLEEHMYLIEIYKRVIHECTDKFSEIEEDGMPMKVCFFPTNKQTIYFRILETL